MTATSQNSQQPVATQSKAIAKFENISEQVLNKIDGSEMLMSEYEQFLVRTAKEAATLPSINQ